MGKSIGAKTIPLLSAAVISVTPALAEEQFPFIGISYGYHTVSPEITQSTSHGAVALRVGKQTMRWRTTFIGEFGSDYTTAGVDVDYILLDELFGTPKLRPYLGANIRYMHYENDLLDESDGYSFGAQTGFIIYASDTIDVDLGYHYNIVEGIDGADTSRGATISFHYFY